MTVAQKRKTFLSCALVILMVIILWCLGVLPKVNYVSRILNGERSLGGLVSDRNIEPVTQFQQEQVEKFCKTYNRSQNEIIPRQLLINDESKVVFCYVPKVGCTTLKSMFFFTNGAIKKNMLKIIGSHIITNESDLLRAIISSSMEAKNQTEREKITRSYYKFMMYRNPIDRLVSAYRSKIEDVPLLGLKTTVPERNWLKMGIYKYKHPRQFKTWKAKGGVTPIHISFSDFIEYWVAHNGISVDEHFQTIFNLCQPCKIRYNYYGNFDTFYDDANVLVKKIRGNMTYLHNDKIWNRLTTADISSRYFKDLSMELKIKIIDMLSEDLIFYYSIFPSQKDKHKLIMNIDYNIHL